MLVLTRKCGERLVLKMGNYRVTLEVLGISRSRTRLGILAPQEIEVLREELERVGEAETRQCNDATPRRPFQAAR
jgi:carbon storage regulator CsrA